VTTAKKANG